MIFYTADDRPGEEVGIRLLVLTLTQHCPDVPIRVVFPPATGAFKRWLAAFPMVDLRTHPLQGAYGWNVKPYALLDALRQDHDEVIWFDTDILLTKDCRPLFRDLSRATLVVCEETYWGQHQGGLHRTLSWGMNPGQARPVTANTGVIRVTDAHRDLLNRWRALLETDSYRQAQRRPAMLRPIHLLSDQEVLTSLLGAHAFGELPVRYLRRGVHIIQNFGPGGYTPTERLKNLFLGLPYLIHAMGTSPWKFNQTPCVSKDPRGYYDALAAELSPYTHVAAQFRSRLGMNCPWLDRRTLPGLLCRYAAFEHASLQGMPQAAFDSLVRRAKRVLAIDRYRVDAASTSPPTRHSPASAGPMDRCPPPNDG